MKKKSYREMIGTFQVHTKDGKEKFLNEIAKWYEAMYPARADFFKQGLRQLREINKNPDGSYRDAKDRECRVRYRVPTELLLFIQRWVPEFGKDSADIDLLVRVWCDLVRPGKERRKVTQVDWNRPTNESVPLPQDEAGCRPSWAERNCPVCQEPGRYYGGFDSPDLCDHHREEYRAKPREDAGVPAQELPPGW